MRDELARALRARRRALARARLRRITSTLDGEADAQLVEAVRENGPRLVPAEHYHPQGEGEEAPRAGAVAQPQKPHRGPWADRMLLAVEVLGAIALVAIIAFSVRSLGNEARAVQITASPPVPTWTSKATATAKPTARPTGRATATRAAIVPAVVDASPTLSCTVTPTATVTATPTEAPTPLSPTGVRIAIPAIEVDAPMVEGDDWETLKGGIGHRIGSAWPGEAGNMVVSAHSDVYGSIFGQLDALQPGDEVIVYAPGATYRYEVEGSRVVLPSEVSVTAPTDEPTLTMITCYPRFIDTHRMVVTARLVE